MDTETSLLSARDACCRIAAAMGMVLAWWFLASLMMALLSPKMDMEKTPVPKEPLLVHARPELLDH